MWREPDSSDYMLMGFSLENLCKGVLIAQTPELVGPAGKLAKEIRTHDVNHLVERALGPQSEPETLLLTVLTNHARWQGRYPLPLEWSDFRLSGEFLRMKELGIEEFERQVEILDTLYSRLWSEVARSDPGPSGEPAARDSS